MGTGAGTLVDDEPQPGIGLVDPEGLGDGVAEGFEAAGEVVVVEAQT